MGGNLVFDIETSSLDPFQRYCQQDVILTQKLHTHLRQMEINDMNSWDRFSLWFEGIYDFFSSPIMWTRSARRAFILTGPVSLLLWAALLLVLTVLYAIFVFADRVIDLITASISAWSSDHNSLWEDEGPGYRRW